MSTRRRHDGWLRAGEIREYSYCRRSWWLRNIVGMKPFDDGRLETGRREHTHHGRLAAGADFGSRLGAALVAAAVLLALLAYL